MQNFIYTVRDITHHTSGMAAGPVCISVSGPRIPEEKTVFGGNSMKRTGSTLAVILVLTLLTGMAQAAFISGSSHRNQLGEAQSFPNITFTSGNPDSQITHAVIDIGSNGLFDGSDFLPSQVAGEGITTVFGPMGTSALTMDFTGFGTGKTWQGWVDDDLNTVIGGTPWTWATGTITVTIDGSCELTGTYVRDGGTGSLQSHADFSGNCGAPAPSVTVLSPDGGETWQAGTTHEITWWSSGLERKKSLRIDLFKARNSYVLTIAESVPVIQRSYLWNIPADLEPGNRYYVIITVTGEPMIRDSSDGVFSITEPGLKPLPGITKPPTDPDFDGIYEDLNANNRLDFADVVLYFNQMQWIAANEPIAAFDLNGNGRIDFADIVALFNEI